MAEDAGNPKNMPIVQFKWMILKAYISFDIPFMDAERIFTLLILATVG